MTDTEACAHNPSTWEVEAVGLYVQGYPWLQQEFKGYYMESPGYVTDSLPKERGLGS